MQATEINSIVLHNILKAAWDGGINLRGITIDKTFKPYIEKLIAEDKSGFTWKGGDSFGSCEITYK